MSSEITDNLDGTFTIHCTLPFGMRQHNWRLLELQQKIADDAARSTIEIECALAAPTNSIWYDISTADPESMLLAPALEYLRLRGRITEHGSLVRVDFPPEE